jgi:hypothetical protein
LKLVDEHGADLNALDPRSDRKEWTAIMNYAYMRQWPEATYLLERGASADHQAPDGQTLTTLLEQRAALYKNEGKQPEPGYTALVAAIQARDHQAK